MMMCIGASISRSRLHFALPNVVLLLESVYVVYIIEPWHEISNNVVCATSNASDQPAHTHSLIRALDIRLSIL